MSTALLTATEARVLDALRAFRALDPPRAPTLRELADRMGWKQPTTAKKYADRLAKKGYVERRRRRSPGVYLVEG